MKKVLAIMLSILAIFSCFGCVEPKSSDNDKYDGINGSPAEIYESFNARVRDYNGNDVCFWNDGKIQFDDFFATHLGQTPVQIKKTATLGVGATYLINFFWWDVEPGEYRPTMTASGWDYNTRYAQWLAKNEPIESREGYIELTSYSLINGENVRFEYDTNKLQVLLVKESNVQYSIRAFQPCDNVEIKISYGLGNEFDRHTTFYVNAQ